MSKTTMLFLKGDRIPDSLWNYEGDQRPNVTFGTTVSLSIDNGECTIKALRRHEYMIRIESGKSGRLWFATKTTFLDYEGQPCLWFTPEESIEHSDVELLSRIFQDRCMNI